MKIKRENSKFSVFVFLVIFSFLLSGCLSPIQRNNNAQEKLDNSRAEIQKIEDSKSERSKEYVFAADYALGLDLEPSIYGQVAKEMAERSLLTTGTPTLREANDFKEIVNNLVSTNSSNKSEGEIQLSRKDARTSILDDKSKAAGEKLEKAQDVFENVAAENAISAQKWEKLMFWIKTIIFSFGGLIVLSLALKVAPPPYNQIGNLLGYFVGGIFKVFAKVIPGTIEGAKVVAKESYDLSEKTLSDLVKGVQEIRHSQNAKAGVLSKQEIDNILLSKTSADSSRLKIIDVKKENGIV